MNENALIIGQIVILITTLAGFWRQLYRENRNRKWDVEDRNLTRIELQTAAQDRKKIAEAVTSQIKENTEISTKAFEEANHVNQKLVDVHQRIEDLIRVFDVAGKPEVTINAENVVVGKKLKSDAE